MASDSEEENRREKVRFHGFSSQEKAITIQQKLIKDFALASEESSDVSETEDERLERRGEVGTSSELDVSAESVVTSDKRRTQSPGPEPLSPVPQPDTGQPDHTKPKPSDKAKSLVKQWTKEVAEPTSPATSSLAPFKLRIKIGKDRSGEVISPDLPADDHEGFHGFPDSEIRDFVYNNFDNVDLKSSFQFQPTIFVSISSKKQARQQSQEGRGAVHETVGGGGDGQQRGSARKQSLEAWESQGAGGSAKKATRRECWEGGDGRAVGGSLRKSLPPLNKIILPGPEASPKSSPSTLKVRFADLVAEKTADPSTSGGLATEKPNLTPSKPGPASEVGKSPASVNKKMARYFEPLYDGWLRELVYRTVNNGPGTQSKIRADVYYTSPAIPGQKRYKFRSPNELEGHLITTGSMYPLTFFTFKKEALGAPEGLEIVRHAGSKAELPENESTQQSLGKRVSKPPDKLMDVKESPEVRSSKRASKPPEKLEPELKSVKKSEPGKSLKVDNSGLWKDPENIVKSPKKSVTTGNGAGWGMGLLKVKMFSKLNASNNMSEDDNIAEKDDDIMEEDPLHIAIPILAVPSQISLSKVPKAVSATIHPRPPVLSRAYPSHIPILPMPTPTLSITPLSSHNLYPNMQAVTSGGGGVLTTMPVLSSVVSGGLHARPPPSPQTTPKIVRPARKTMLPCSIHCPGVIGFPSLSCTSCHCLFHPKCVGLPPSFSRNSTQFDFFCNDCQPNVPDMPALSPQQKATPPPPAHPSWSPAVRPMNIPTQKPPPPQLAIRPQPPKLTPVEPLPPPKKRVVKGPQSSRPIESQTMVSIGGKKFLVIPRANIELDSPPPSPPALTPERTEGARKLPVLLESVDKTGGDIPRFEVEQARDGRLILKPIGSVDTASIFGSNQIKRSAGGDSDARPSKRLKTGPVDLMKTLSSGYFAILHVMKYLSFEERLKAARVCRLWRDLAYHQSLWGSLSLKNVKITDWSKLSTFIRRVDSQAIDMRKMVFLKDRDSTWADVLSVATSFSNLRKIQLPRISGSILTELVSCCPQLEMINSPLTTSPLDSTFVEKVPNLKELRLKTGIGSLKLESGLKPLELLAGSLTSLSLLTLNSLEDSDYDSIGTLSNLEQIELGDCVDAPVTIFKTLSDLVKLQRIRLEKGSVGENISKLQKSDNLRELELIDFHVLPGFKAGLKGINNVRRFLIIPTYKDEVARSNTEIVDGVTSQLKHLDAFYLGVTNEWLEAMAMVIGEKQSSKAAAERDCFPLEKEDRVEYISLPGLYRRICRELPNTKVKVLKMSAGATCKQFIQSLQK